MSSTREIWQYVPLTQKSKIDHTNRDTMVGFGALLCVCIVNAEMLHVKSLICSPIMTLETVSEGADFAGARMETMAWFTCMNLHAFHEIIRFLLVHVHPTMQGGTCTADIEIGSDITIFGFQND